MIIRWVERPNQKEREFTRFGNKDGILQAIADGRLHVGPLKSGHSQRGHRSLLLHPLHLQAQDHYPLAHLQNLGRAFQNKRFARAFGFIANTRIGNHTVDKIFFRVQPSAHCSTRELPCMYVHGGLENKSLGTHGKDIQIS